MIFANPGYWCNSVTVVLMIGFALVGTQASAQEQLANVKPLVGKWLHHDAARERARRCDHPRQWVRDDGNGTAEYEPVNWVIRARSGWRGGGRSLRALATPTCAESA